MGGREVSHQRRRSFAGPTSFLGERAPPEEDPTIRSALSALSRDKAVKSAISALESGGRSDKGGSGSLVPQQFFLRGQQLDQPLLRQVGGGGGGGVSGGLHRPSYPFSVVEGTDGHFWLQLQHPENTSVAKLVERFGEAGIIRIVGSLKAGEVAFLAFPVRLLT